MICPKCKADGCQAITETSGSTKGFSAGKGCCGILMLGPFGWLCGLCGMGKGKTESTTYWICSNCGHKFKA